VEAAASGTAVVCSDLPAHRETLGDGALFFPPRDIAALTEYLQRIVADPEFRADVARRGRANVSRLSWDAGAERLQAVLSAAAKR
jgi:glycosyltransferase involved in cell wall biosynthesis